MLNEWLGLCQSLWQCHWSDPCSSTNFLERQAILRPTILLLIFSLADWPWFFFFLFREESENPEAVAYWHGNCWVGAREGSYWWCYRWKSSAAIWSDTGINQDVMRLGSLIDDKKLNKTDPPLRGYKSRVRSWIHSEWIDKWSSNHSNHTTLTSSYLHERFGNQVAINKEKVRAVRSKGEIILPFESSTIGKNVEEMIWWFCTFTASSNHFFHVFCTNMFFLVTQALTRWPLFFRIIYLPFCAS